MFDFCQLRVEDLHRRLDASLAVFQRSANRKEVADSAVRTLHCVKQNSKEVFIELVEPGARPRLERLLAASAPLKVVCEPSSTHSPNSAELHISPAESTDSGVGFSPAASPTSSNGKQSPFYEYSEENRGMRQRSASESISPSQHNGGSLKGILKKPKRYVRLLSRSASECHGQLLSDESAPDLRFSELIECSDEERDDDEQQSQLIPRQKRVSFSEKVDRRIFKAGQCIATQARKNEKRRLQKKRKEEERRRASLSDAETSPAPNLKPCLVVERRSLSMDNDDDVFDGDDDDISDKAKPASVASSDRQDSGFGDCEDDADASPAEEVWKAAVRRQRNAVSV